MIVTQGTHIPHPYIEHQTLMLDVLRKLRAKIFIYNLQFWARRPFSWTAPPATTTDPKHTNSLLQKKKKSEEFFEKTSTWIYTPVLQSPILQRLPLGYWSLVNLRDERQIDKVSNREQRDSCCCYTILINPS